MTEAQRAVSDAVGLLAAALDLEMSVVARDLVEQAVERLERTIPSPLPWPLRPQGTRGAA